MKIKTEKEAKLLKIFRGLNSEFRQDSILSYAEALHLGQETAKADFGLKKEHEGAAI